jgi:hypothetical protein
MKFRFMKKKKKPHPYAGEAHERARQRAKIHQRMYEIDQQLENTDLSEEKRNSLEEELAILKQKF